MRILAIRGCNLASLAGEFEIDLAHGPLGGAGVFAIVGPTGAGKSSLLDAMCVALFDRTPRLANRSTFDIGRGDDDPAALGAQDVRSLLRRGSSAGWAEVDFESGDARQYRARWSVRRARGASDGRFQDQQVTLTAIDDGERFGGTKTETLKAIHQRLGLTFDQFRRSALLAQGEFAAFLRADGKDRSELLERMTGTEIYSRLSIAAHARAGVAEQRLRERQGVAAAIAVLADDARQAAERELATAIDARGAARMRLAEAEAAARWRVEADARVQALADAERARADADAAVEASADDRARLAMHRRAEALRPVWDAATRLDRQLAIARGEAAEAGVVWEAAASEQQRVAEVHARLVAVRSPVRAARIAAGIVEQDGGAPGDVDAGALVIASAAAAADVAWLVERRGLADVVATWRELDARFVQRAVLGDEIAAADRELADRAKRRAALDRQRAQAIAEHHAAVARLAETRAELARFEHRRGLSLDAAGRQEDEARRACAESDRLVAIAANAREVAVARGKLDRQRAELVAAAATDVEARRAAEHARDTALVLRDDRARVAVELRRAAGYGHARAELVAGEPCPLCGSSEHPWHGRGAFDALIGDAEQRLGEAAAQLDAAIGAVAAIAARDAQRGAERTRVDTSDAALIEASADAASRWRDQLAALGELVLVTDPASDAAAALVHERAQAALGVLEAARTARSQAAAVAKALAEAQAAVQARQVDVELAAARPRELAAAIAALDAAVAHVHGERAGKAERHAELGHAIAAAVARWAAALPGGELGIGDANARAAISDLATAWRDRAARIAELDATLARATADVDRRALAGERAVAEHAVRRAEAERRRDALATELADAQASCAAARISAGFEPGDLSRLLATELATIELLAEQLAAFDRAADRARTRLAERRRHVDDHAATRPASLADADHLAELAAAVAAADHRAAALTATIAVDTDARARRTEALAQLAAAERAAEIDRVLGGVIGSHDGKLFRSFAQSLTLDALLEIANAHLEELAPRYQLERVPRHDLELQVVDRDLGGEVRSVQSLSGGESFLVSLALALALSSMSAHDVRVRTLLIDEGFGTLDPATLDGALAVLDALQATGRQIGVISHVPALVERVGAHVRVAPRGGGRSDVVTSA